MGGHGSSDETNGPTVKENNALSGGKSSNNQQGSQTSLSVPTKEKESAILSTENTAQVPLSSHTQSLTDRHKILHQLLQENDKNPSIQTSVGEPTTFNNNTVSLSAPKNDKGGMQKKEKHILLRYLLDKEEPCNPSSPPLGFGPHSKVDEATAATVDSSDNIDSSQNSINMKCNPSEKEPGNLNSVKQVDDTEPLQQKPEGEENHKDLDRVFEAESHTTQCTPVTFSLASNVRRSMGRSLSATCSPIGAPFPRPGLMRSRSTIAGATSNIGVCSRPHGGQGSFCEPSQARLSSGVTEAMIVGTGSSVQTSGTGQLSEGIPQPMCMPNMERAWLGHEGRTVSGSHRADVPRMTLLSASSTRQIQGSVEQALGRPYHLTNCSGGTGACHCDSAMAADVGTGGNVNRVEFPVSLDELLWTQAGGETQVTNNALFQYLDSLLSSVDEEELTKIDHALGIDKFLQAMSSSNSQRMLAAPVGGNVQLRRQVQQRLQAQQRQLVAHGRPMIPTALGHCRNPPVPSYVQKPPAPGQPLLLNGQMMPQLRREILNQPIILQQHQGYTPCSGSMTTMPRLPLGQQHYSYQVASGAVGVGNHAVNASWRGPGPPSVTSRHFGPSLGSQMQTYHFPTTGMPRESAFGAAAGCPTSAELGLVRMPAPGHVTNAAGLDSWHRGGNRISLTPSTQQPFLANRDPGTFNNMNVSVPLGSTNMRSLECTGNTSRHPDARPLGSTSVSQLQVLADVQCTVNMLGSDSNYTGQSNSLVYHGQSDISAHPPGASGQRNSLLQQLLME
uniref:Nuclear receptor coactivator Ncoa-type interlocking domain-containing protein n=1 Tax=Eptatretus burgeri TaxID=7764 RepID=A0A8C4QGB0_EPTBU